MQGGDAQNYPEFEDPVEQEAARFLFSDFTSEKGHNASEETHLHAGPVIRGITDESRLHTWIEFAKEHSDRVAKADRDALRQRLRELSVDEDVEFERASEIPVEAEPEPAVADGGAVVEESGAEVEATSETGKQWAIGDHQEAMEYADEAAFESKKNEKRRVVQDLIDTVEEAEAALDREYEKDVVPTHLTELLEERLAELRGETDGE